MGVRHGCLFWTPLPTTLSRPAMGIRFGCLLWLPALYFLFGVARYG